MAGLRKSGDRSDRDSHDEPPVELVPAPHPGSTSSGGSSRPTQSVPRRRLVLDRDHPGPPPSLPLPPPPSASDTPVIGMTSPSPADLPISTPEDRLFVLCLDALVHVTDMWVTTASSASERSSCHRIGRDVGTLREQHTTQNFTSRFDEGDLGGRQTVLTLLGEILIIVHTEIPNNLALRQDEKSRQDFETLLRQLEDAAEAVHSHDSVAFAMPPLGWLLPEKSDVLFMLAEYTDKIFEQFEKMGSSS